MARKLCQYTVAHYSSAGQRRIQFGEDSQLYAHNPRLRNTNDEIFFLDSTSETKGESEVFSHGLEGSSAAEPESGESKVDDGSRPDPVSSREHFHRE